MNCYMDTNIDKTVSNIDLDESSESELHVGDLVAGVIAHNLKQFSFVKIGNLSCVLPLSEISFDKKPKSLKVGTEIKAVVIRISEENGVMLSIKRATTDPWSNIDEKYHVGQRVNVKVKNITGIGAFVELEQNLSGLIRRKDLSIKRHIEPEEIVSVGQFVGAEIISIEKERRRIHLSMKVLMEDPWTHVQERYSIGQKFTKKVIDILDYGAFIEIEPGVEALLHRTEMGLTKSDKVEHYLSLGDELEVEICTLDVENRKMSLKCDSFSNNHNNTIETNE